MPTHVGNIKISIDVCTAEKMSFVPVGDWNKSCM